MKVGLQISSFTWDGGDAAIGETLAGIVRTADDVRAVASLAGEAPVIAKIELAQALDNLDG